jgi:aminopeptidase N
VFFRALRRFYVEHRFSKAGTDDLRQAFTAESGRDLTRFFEQWIYGSDLPLVRWSTKTEGQGPEQVLVVRIEQPGDKVFDFPLTVTLQFADGNSKDVIVPVTDRTVDQRIPFSGTLRGVQVNRDRAALIREES